MGSPVRVLARRMTFSARFRVLAAGFGVHPQEIDHGHVGQEMHVLGELGHQLLSGIRSKLGIGNMAVDQDLATGGRVTEGELLDIGYESALARARRADDADNLSPRDLDLVHIVRIPVLVHAADDGQCQGSCELVLILILDCVIVQ